MPSPDLARLPFPNLARACFQIALDNGGINRRESETAWARDYVRFVARDRWPEPVLAEVDRWLGTLSEDDLDIVCCGEEGEAHLVVANGPGCVNELLNDYFNSA